MTNKLHPTLCYRQILPQEATILNFTVRDQTESTPKLHAFNQRLVRPWNSLPDNIVNAKNTNSFKNLLDKHWENLPLRFSYLSVPQF